MSSNIYYRPVPKSNGTLLPDQLKFALKKLDEWNGKAEGTYSKDFIPVLEGMKAAGVDGADQLIKAIKKYGEVEIEEIY
jgi:hypothetical protein